MLEFLELLPLYYYHGDMSYRKSAKRGLMPDFWSLSGVECPNVEPAP